NQEADLLGKLARMRNRVDRIAVKAGSDPALRQYQDELRNIRETLSARRKRLRPIVADQLRRAARTDLRVGRDNLMENIADLTRLEGLLNEEVEKTRRGVHSFNTDTLDLQSLQDEIAQAEETAKKVGSQMEALSVELEAPPRVRLLELAEPPRDADPSKKHA